MSISHLRRVLACSAFLALISVLPLSALAPEYRTAYLVVNDQKLSATQQAPVAVETVPPAESSSPIDTSDTEPVEDTPAGVGGQSPLTHVVAGGDTLSGIAARYNMTVQRIRTLNSLRNPHLINPGQTLLLMERPPEPRRHRVRAGENLSVIAASHGVTVTAIIDLNDLTQTNLLSIGQVLSIPAAATVTEQARIHASASGMIWPVIGRISSYFGPRWGTRHTGLDIAAPTGTEIRAVRAGRVEKAGWWGGYGNCVIINHGDGVRTLYAHASRLLVKRGERVVQGQVVARVGSTGNSTGPHVHFEVRVNNRFKDPINFLP
ncbi:MAG: Murein hydrolase activator NlpD [Firmicutes bacterium]|nr:Murein hydrolase activator NlpD [candidate division NPL-UPA2 bacterium]